MILTAQNKTDVWPLRWQDVIFENIANAGSIKTIDTIFRQGIKEVILVLKQIP